jgi:nicotinamide riboside transporter PnuC
MTVLTWLLTVLSLIGVALNIRQNRACFFIWCVTNTSWAAVDYSKELYAQSFMFLVYLAFSIWGIIEWKRKKNA